MWTLLLLILLYFLYVVLKPVIKVWRTVHKAQKGDFSGFSDFFGQPGAQKSRSAYDSEGNRKGGWTKARTRKKKIGKDVGEYVKFSEITISEQERAASAATSDASKSRNSVTEQQVSEIEWEEINTI